ncbi:Lrp/AsnC family transcriptional regulator [Nakamurella silvestris]|nr:Lrp/AsnC family transcriptional regulator [Nakamurella silvestris]
MRSDAPALFPVFRSQAQARILAAVLLRPDAETSPADLHRRLGLPLTTVADEVRRLVAAGIFLSRSVGRSNLVRANTDQPTVTPLTQLVMLTLGPRDVIEEEFSVLGASRVLIFGSWAARYQGEPGKPPNDVDVLLVGKVDRDAVYAAAERAQERLTLAVNPVIVSERRWNDPTDPLMSQIRAAPIVDLRAPS